VVVKKNTGSSDEHAQAQSARRWGFLSAKKNAKLFANGKSPQTYQKSAKIPSAEKNWETSANLNGDRCTSARARISLNDPPPKAGGNIRPLLNEKLLGEK